MSKLYSKSLFIFRRDLRLSDNTALIQALKQSQEVMVLFVFDERQIGASNEYRSIPAMRFMIESLQELAADIEQHKGRLHVAKGIVEKVIADMLETQQIEAVFLNKDYTPFSVKRDQAIEEVCRRADVVFHAYHDALLNAPETVMTKKGTFYTIFTPFFKAAFLIEVDKPIRLSKNNMVIAGTCGHTLCVHVYKGGVFKCMTMVAFVSDLFSKKDFDLLCEQGLLLEKDPSYEKSLLSDVRSEDDMSLSGDDSFIRYKGGRKKGLHILKKLSDFKNYKKERDFPAISTTHLSAHHKFGTISIRESYYAIKEHLGSNHPLIRQLYWRDFFYHIAYHVPTVFGHAYRPAYEHLPWSTNELHFTAWCDGRTGFPLVDAGMRQLKATGFMHNRVRLVVASFLIKDLHINWLWGEKYFAQNLVDYDPCVNNGNWQWVASTGCDAQPYFRIFNPWLQQKRYDPDCVYIRKWVPELQKVAPTVIHKWYNRNSPLIEGYPRPLIDHEIESRKAKDIFRKKATIV